jgi:hypothetical protein
MASSAFYIAGLVPAFCRSVKQAKSLTFNGVALGGKGVLFGKPDGGPMTHRKSECLRPEAPAGGGLVK